LLSELPADVGGVGFAIPDKIVHLGLYLVLGGTLAWAKGKTPSAPVPLLLFLGMAYGALDEWHQAFVPGRDPSLGDFVADCAGVALGFILLRSRLKLRPSDTGEATT